MRDGDSFYPDHMVVVRTLTILRAGGRVPLKWS